MFSGTLKSGLPNQVIDECKKSGDGQKATALAILYLATVIEKKG